MNTVNIKELNSRLKEIQKILIKEKRKMGVSAIARQMDVGIATVYTVINYPIAELKYGIVHTKCASKGRKKYWYQKQEV